MQLTVAGIQMAVTDDISLNLCSILRGLRSARECGADILLTPEGSLSGYHAAFKQHELNEALCEVTATAARYGIGLALGTCFFEDDGACYNQIRFYHPSAEYIGSHAKILLCGNLEQPPRGEMEYFATKPLSCFVFKGITVGGLLCNDLWANPTCTPMPDLHLSQQLARMGVKIIFHGVNGWRDNHEFTRTHQFNFHESNLLLRAMAGRLWIVTVDNASPLDTPVSCCGGVVSPAGERVLKANPIGEQFFNYTINL